MTSKEIPEALIPSVIDNPDDAETIAAALLAAAKYVRKQGK
ncbi:hypothetical protein [Mycobacteroides abscessus]|nr:hypothetical protein [Mycobacteroides abscessus]